MIHGGTARSEGVMRRLSFGAKVWLWFVASVLVFAFVAFVASSYYVDHLQKRNVSAVVALAQEQARQLRQDLVELLVAQTPGGDVSSPAFRAGARKITSVAIRLNQNIEWAMIVDNEGNKILQTTRDGEMVLQPVTGSRSSSDLPLPGGVQGEIVVDTRGVGEPVEVREPLDHEGRKVGEIRFKLADSRTYRGIEETSRQITEVLVAGAVGFLLFLLTLFAVLWRLFSRQITLTQQNAELDRMAYVGTLASGLAHEIRNPLSAMNVNLDVLQEELAEVTDQDVTQRAGGIAGRLQTEVRQLNATLTSFLDFALPQRESFIHFSLRGLVEELLDLHSLQCAQAGVEVEVTGLPTERTEVEGDRRLLHQALRNLIVNAIQIMEDAPAPKRISIHFEAAPRRMIRVSIADSGPGIAPGDMDQLFEAFFSRRKGGSGLGLAVAWKVVQEHGGRIHAHNNANGRGACFLVELPQEQRG